ncbi:hypothetical protein CB1_000465046 [Camelus ferus]|nr:hypothetical protein CB1_000465046 [Camelus ferus]
MATQTVLLPMGFFEVIYYMDCMTSTLRTVWFSEPARLLVQILVNNGYATVSPLVLISTEKRIIKFLKSCWERC